MMEHETPVIKSISVETILNESNLLSIEEVNNVRIERNKMETQLVRRICEFENLKISETNIENGFNNGRLEMFEIVL